MAKSHTSDADYFSSNIRANFFSPKFSFKQEISNTSHELIRQLKFPWNIKDMIHKYPYAKIRQINIIYTPYIWVTNHGKVVITVKDRRKASLKEQNICILETPTEVQTQFEIKDLESCSRLQKNPINLSISLETIGLAPDAIVGHIEMFATFSYSRFMFPMMIPSISINKVSSEGYEKRFYRNDESAMIKVAVERCLVV